MELYKLLEDAVLKSAKSKIRRTAVKSLSRTADTADANSLFFDLRSTKEIRAETIAKIKKRSPVAAVTAEPKDFEGLGIPVIYRENPRRAYAEAYSDFCEINYSKFCVIGVTGTNGKTSTATVLKHIFDSVGIKTGFIGTGKILCDSELLTDKNYSMTSPDPEVLYPALKRIENAGCEILVMEVSSHSLALEKVYPIPYEIAVFTGLSMEHLDFHGSMENYFSEKEKLICRARRSIINCDDEYGKALYEKYREKSKSISVSHPADSRALQITSHGLYGSEYVLKSEKCLSRINIKLPGMHNIYNSMLAFCAATAIGITPRDVKNALSKIKSIDGRCELIRGKVTVIIDYAHTPFALESLLKTVRSGISAEQSLTLIFGCGGERDRIKRPEMARVAEKFCSKIIVTTDNPREEDEDRIINDITAGFSGGHYMVIKDRAEAIIHAIRGASRNEIIVIAGKGHESYQLDKNGYHAFDEKTLVKEALKLKEAEEGFEN